MDEIKEILVKFKGWVREVDARKEPDFNKALDAYCDLDEAAAQLQALFDKRVEGIFKSIEKIFVHKPSGRFLGTIDNPKYQALKSKIKEEG